MEAELGNDEGNGDEKCQNTDERHDERPQAPQISTSSSGTTERGEHIWRTHAEAAVRQCTVIAADIVTADVLATAIVAAGRTFADNAVHEHGISVRIAFDDGTELHLSGSVPTNGQKVR